MTDTEEIDQSLDSLLSKYGASRRSVQHAAEDSELSRGDNEECHDRVEQPSQFLKEIRERAEILSRNAAKARKVALQNVVNEDSKSHRSTSANSSLDMFVDVIRSANIADENTTSSSSMQTDDEDLISSDDLLQPILPLDAAPWSAGNPKDSGRPWDFEGSLDTGGPWMTRGHEGSTVIESPWGVDGSRTAEVPWKCDSAWRTDDCGDVVESKEIEGPWKAITPQGMEDPWNTENKDLLSDYGLSTEPWGTSTSQTNDEITESEDSDTTSEESSDCEDDVDCCQGNISTNSTQNAGSLTLDREQGKLASYERSDNVVEHRDNSTSLVWNLQTYCPLSKQTENTDVESEDLWSNTAVVDEESEEEEDDDEEDEDEVEDDEDNRDVINDRVQDGFEIINNSNMGELPDTVSSIIVTHMYDSDLVASSPNQSQEEENHQIDDKMSWDDGFKLVNEFHDRVTYGDVAKTEDQVDTTREMQTVSAKEDGLKDEDQALCRKDMQELRKSIPEDEGQGAGLCDEVMDNQLTTEIMDVTLVGSSLEVCERSDVAVEKDKDSCGKNDDNVCTEISVKDNIEGIKKASSLHVEHSTCLGPLLPSRDISFSANDDDAICVRNRDETEERTKRGSLSPQPEHPGALNRYDLLLPTVTDMASTVQDSNDGKVQDEMDESTRYHSLHPENSSALIDSDTSLMDSSSSVFKNNDGNILDVSLEKDVKAEAIVDKTTSGYQPLCSEHLSALDQDDSMSLVTDSSFLPDDIIHVGVRTDLNKGRNDDLKERELSLISVHPEFSSNSDEDKTLLEKTSTSDKKHYMDDCHKEDEPDEDRKDADKVHLKIQSQTMSPLNSKSADVSEKDVSVDKNSTENPEEQASGLVKRRSLGDGSEGSNKETFDAGHNFSSSCRIPQHSFKDEQKEHDETLLHGSNSCTQSLSLESMNNQSNTMEVAMAMTETKCDYTTSKTVNYNVNNSNVGNSGRENLGDTHNIMLQQNIESINFVNLEKDVRCPSEAGQSTKTVTLMPSCSGRTTLDSPKENLKLSEKQVFKLPGADQDIVRMAKADYKTEKLEAKKVKKGRHPAEGLERSQKVYQHKSEQSVGTPTKHKINSSQGASSASSGCQSTLRNLDTRTKDLKGENSSDQRGVNPEGDDEGVRAGNVRNLIARFNSGSVLASDSPGSEVRKCGRDVSRLDGRVTARLTSMEDADDDRPSMHKESSEAAKDTVNQIIPWMQELAKRRKRRGQSSVWEKLTHQISDK